MGIKNKTIDNTKLDLYRRLVATNSKVALKGDRVPYTALHGHMFSYLHPSGSFALRLPEQEREKFLCDHHTTLFEAYGTVQREYVTVPNSLFARTDDLKRYFDLSYRYVATLKPRPQRRTK